MNSSANRSYDRNVIISNLFDIGKMIDIDMDKKTISVLIELLDAGVHPEALVDGKHKYSNQDFFSFI